MYLPANGCPEEYGPCIDDLIEMCESREPGSSIIIGGDVNGDIGTLRGDRGSRPPNNRGVQFNEVVNQFNLMVCNMWKDCVGPVNTHFGPTGASTIDYLCIPEEMSDRLIKCSVSDNEPLNTSDHVSVHITLNIDKLPQIQADPIVKTRRWDKLTPQAIHDTYTYPVGRALSSVIDSIKYGVESAQEIDGLIDTIVEILTERSCVIPTSKFRRHNKPFWNNKLSDLKRCKVEKFRLWDSLGRPREADNIAWVEHKKAKRNFAREIKRISKDYENQQILQAVKDAELDKNAFWKVVKKCRSSSGSNANAIKNDRDKAVYETDEILQAWQEHFSRLCIPSEDTSFDEEHFRMVSERVRVRTV